MPTLTESTTPVQHGHFQLESGLHTDVWLELDAWFLNPAALQPRIHALANQLQPHAITAVCGPLVGGAFVAQSIAARLGLRFYYTERSPGLSGGALFSTTYRLPAGMRADAARESFAIVDDVISAGSSTRATFDELNRCGARTVVVGALLLLGNRGERHFVDQSIPVVAAAREELSLWEPGSCPLCQAGIAIEQRA